MREERKGKREGRTDGNRGRKEERKGGMNKSQVWSY